MSENKRTVFNIDFNDDRLVQARHRILFERSPDTVIVTAANGRILDFNPASLVFFDIAEAELHGSNITTFYANQTDRDHLLQQADNTGLVPNAPIIFVDHREKVKHALVTIMRLDHPRGGVYGYLSVIRDVTQRRLAEKRLHSQKNFAEQLFDAGPEAIAILDMDDRVIRVNDEFCRLFRYPPEACIGRRMESLIVPEALRAESFSYSARVLAGERFEVETQRMDRNGRLIDVSILAKPIVTENDEPAIYVIYHDITQRRRKDAELRYVAYHDTLTGLPNRKSFYMVLDDLLQHASRRGSDRTWALMFLDLDKFKQVNDTLGHDTGDLLLKAVAKRLNQCLRETDHLFRLGGDEFTVILTNLNRDIDVARVARKILASISQVFRFDGHEIFTTASIGISVFPNDGWDVEGLVKNADMAMYAAKENGGGDYRFFTEEMNRQALHRMQMESHLRKAIGNNELLLYYQPFVDRASRIVGMEALIRWHHPELGLILPADFIRITEDTGIIVPVGRWVLATACNQVKAWHDMGFDTPFVSVNISARQLQESDFEQTVLQAIDASGLPPACLNLEVTESSMIQNPEACIAKMQHLRSRGVRFSIDDFGTGYSSLSYLKRFPIDALKIDRSFVSDLMKSKGDQEIVKTIISMARNLNIDAVAEGVETQAQMDFLIRCGCDTMQGYLFARPLPAEQFADLLERQKHRESSGQAKTTGRESEDPAP
ncbi:GGDEF domain-containing protein [Desulfosarcina ovata subsp. sediminis]|uniref:GGDEF domain-containing protein n=1 Tax=Desulfosarcina ovata subsp. sediminis TaxID=885957 RepID=A0A5K7ZPF0_9BACT|nr:EAL domain-containing protein [Desulfosarcina ovata]BBO81709.1 GGDEF domain-containing protein [Desulfosarcina ovata subsp. sediminis]